MVKYANEEVEKQILYELRGFGITRVVSHYNYHLDDYYPLRFIIHFLEEERYLKSLKSLLSVTPDEALVYKDSNALMWAGTYLAHQKLLLLQERKAFISAHIRDQDQYGRTALHYVADSYSDDPEAIRLLVSWGAAVNARDNHHSTPLHLAATHNQNCDGRWDALCELGARERKDDEGKTPSDIRDWMDALDAW